MVGAMTYCHRKDCYASLSPFVFACCRAWSFAAYGPGNRVWCRTTGKSPFLPRRRKLAPSPRPVHRPSSQCEVGVGAGRASRRDRNAISHRPSDDHAPANANPPTPSSFPATRQRQLVKAMSCCCRSMSARSKGRRKPAKHSPKSFLNARPRRIRRPLPTESVSRRRDGSALTFHSPPKKTSRRTTLSWASGWGTIHSRLKSAGLSC